MEEAQRNSTADVSTGLADLTLGAAGPTGTQTSLFSTGANLTTVDVAIAQTPNALFFHQDQLGTTRMLTDGVGAVRATFTYDPYGNLTASTGYSSTAFLFAGQYRDAESGLYYLRARYYDPATAQFLTVDPRVATTLSPYGYLAGNPLNGTDPSGDCGGPLGFVCTAWDATAGQAVHAVQNSGLCLRNPFGAGWNSNSNGGCQTVLTGSQGTELAAATVVIAAATVFTGGLADEYLGAYLSAGEEGTTLGTLDQIQLLLHAPLVFLPGLTVGAIGAYLIYLALTDHSSANATAGCS